MLYVRPADRFTCLSARLIRLCDIFRSCYLILMRAWTRGRTLSGLATGAAGVSVAAHAWYVHIERPDSYGVIKPYVLISGLLFIIAWLLIIFYNPRGFRIRRKPGEKTVNDL